MTTTFKFAKTKVHGIRNELTQDQTATCCFDICDGFARIRVDNHDGNLAEFDSQKATVKDNHMFDQKVFELPKAFLCDLAENNLPLRIKAHYDPSRKVYFKLLLRGLHSLAKG